MTDWDAKVREASDAWRRWCRALEETGAAVLGDTMTRVEVDLAEGLRHLGRVAGLHLANATENRDAANPYFWPALGPHLKMGGDNPQGLYLSAPVDGADVFRIRGRRGSAAWVSIILKRSAAGRAKGLAPFGEAIFLPQLRFEPDGAFELFISPERQGANWLASDAFSEAVLIRQFFGAPADVRPMELTIENLTRGGVTPPALDLATAVAGLGRGAAMFQAMTPMMQSELIGKGAAKNSFATDVGDPTSTSGGVPGGNAVTARWSLEPHQALLVEVTPPSPCAYWDVQVGNGWYESWDYRNFFSGLTCEQAHRDPGGSVTLVLSQADPGVCNWLEAAHHREGHIAIRWQLSDGHLPLPRCSVVEVGEVAGRTGLPAVSPEERQAQRQALRASFDARFGV